MINEIKMNVYKVVFLPASLEFQPSLQTDEVICVKLHENIRIGQKNKGQIWGTGAPKLGRSSGFFHRSVNTKLAPCKKRASRKRLKVEKKTKGLYLILFLSFPCFQLWSSSLQVCRQAVTSAQEVSSALKTLK